MEKLVYIQDNEIPKFNYLADFGSFNRLPQPFKEITEEQFYKQFDTWAWQYKDFRQVCNTEDLTEVNWQGYFDITIYFYSDSAYGRAKKVSKNDCSKYDYKYFRIGCKHEWELVSSMRCYREYKCRKCGCTDSVDSSD